MKQIMAIGMILIFCFAEIRPLLPFVEYFLNYEYITKVLCINKDDQLSSCNGKCFLSHQLEIVQEDDQHEKRLPKIEFKTIPIICTDIDLFSVNNFEPSSEGQLVSHEDAIKDIFISPPTPPPES